VRSELERLGPQAQMLPLLERWEQTLGQAIARHAWPARFGRAGTLHVHTSDSVWAFELAQQSAEIASRLGVPAVRFAPGPLPEPSGTEVLSGVAPTPEEEAQAAAVASAVGDEKLRKHVQKAISFSLAKHRSGRVI
jgi:hypothetical protein